jgi:opacity protein-like surface antigen
MNKSILLKIFFLFSAGAQIIGSTASGAQRSALDNAYCFGPAILYTVRDGYYDFTDIQKSRQVSRNSLLMYGVGGAKRFGLNKFVRLQIGLNFDMGSVVDDTLSTTLVGKTTPSPIGVKHAFSHAGLAPELQFCAPMTDRTLPFVRLGGGLNYVSGAEQMSVLNSDTLVTGMDPQTVYKSPWNFDVMAGFGLDILISRSMAICLSYSFRYWQPIKGSIEDDFPLTALPYHETFYSHGIQATMLFEIN